MPVTEGKKKTMIKQALAALAISGGLALAAPAAHALAAPATSAATTATTAPATTYPSVLPAPGGLRAAASAGKATLTWYAVAGATVYELKVSGPARFDRVLAASLRSGAVIRLTPGRYAAAVRAGRTAHDVHGHWSAPRYFTVPALAGSSTAARALAWAFAQAGKPYAYGAAGPNSFDCSGLAMEAYGHADGIWLPHNTGMMLSSGKLVRTFSPQPGDLAFYGTGHVELYVRPGYTWGAHHSGTVIGYTRYAGSSWQPTMFERVT